MKKITTFLVLTLGGCVLFAFFFYKRLTTPFAIATAVNVKKGDAFTIFVKKLPPIQKLKVKARIKWKNVDLTKISIGTYIFSGLYTPQTFLEAIRKGPQTTYIPVTILEGWSIYDIDEALARAGNVKTGEYKAYVTNEKVIKKMKETFPFLTELGREKLQTLEGVLYPDTYFIDVSKDFIEQLTYQQLKTFYTKVRTKYKNDFLSFPRVIKEKTSYTLQLTPYESIILASILEKEEKNPDNQPVIAGIFFNRLAKGMRLDADISLCYGLGESYKTCQNNLNLYNLKNAKNPYNTRAVGGLPPTPIANPSVRTIKSLLEFEVTDYMYYLHDPKGNIHYAKTIEEHTMNKNLYLK